ncbi:MAG: hypothetical protein IKX03_01710 [Bacteroidales bacterium]|nr:hypothetical protein [Bacteroidales bacterium]
MKEKLSYLTPRCEAVCLAPESGCLQTGSPYGDSGRPGGDSGYNDYGTNWF